MREAMAMAREAIDAVRELTGAVRELTAAARAQSASLTQAQRHADSLRGMPLRGIPISIRDREAV